MKKEKIAAVLVTYNRKELLIKSIEALLSQTYSASAIYIINNASTDGTEELLLEKKFISPFRKGSKENNIIRKKINVRPYLEEKTSKKSFKKSVKKSLKKKTATPSVEIVYVRMKENLGGAGGFSEGIRIASEEKHDWLWIMDDDAAPEKSAFEKLSPYFGRENVVAIAGSVCDPDGSPQTNHRGTISFKSIFPLMQKPLPREAYDKDELEIDMISFVGTLIKVSAVKKIGLPKAEFFIHNDDVEYSIRLREIGKILFIPSCIITHYDVLQKNRHKRSFFGRITYRRANNTIWLFYFGQRNLAWLGKKYCENRPLFYFQLLLNFGRQLTGILLYDEYKIIRIKTLVKAFLDGLKGDFSNTYPFELKKRKFD